MADLDSTEEKQIVEAAGEAQKVAKLLELLEPQANPWRVDWLTNVVAECYNFKELRQWDGEDMQKLNVYDVPPIAVDRTGRVFDGINGVRDNTGTKKQVQKEETGDERVASLLDAVFDFVEYSGNFDEPKSKTFDDMLTTGAGWYKFGFDPTALGGEGQIWVESCEIEDIGHSKCKKLDATDAKWFWHRQVMDWEDAILYAPEKAGELKSLRLMLEAEWEKIKGNVPGNIGKDYGGSRMGEPAYKHPDQVEVIEFWYRERTVVQKVGFMGPDGSPQIREAELGEEIAEGEQFLANTVLDRWKQCVVARGGQQGVLLKEEYSEFNFPPFVRKCAAVKKSGQPFGLVERIIPHQKRINLAWAQKTAWNNKSIKAPLILKGSEGVNVDAMMKGTSIGTVMQIPASVQDVILNQVPNINLQAVEEGNIARQDMDFAAAATEAPLRGASSAGTSGVKLSLEQNAAITPLNTWVKADKAADLSLGRKILEIIVAKYSPQRMRRIVGDRKFVEVLIGPLDPMTGQPTMPPLPMPLTIDVAQYDVRLVDQAVSDFNKQTSFNAIEALVAGGVPLDDTFRITNAPIKDVDGALESNQKARADIIQQLLMQNQMLQEENEGLQKQIPKTPGSQARNASTGRGAPQAGKRSMVGGQKGVFGMNRS